MLDQLIKTPRALARWRSGVLGPHLDLFLKTLSDLGYTRSSIKAWLLVLGDLQQWLEGNNFGVSALEESLLERFLQDRKRRRQREGKTRTVVGIRTVYFLLDHLRQQGVVVKARPPIARSPLALIRRRYDDYLRRTRGLSSATCSRYWPFLDQFLRQRFGSGALRFGELTPDEVSAFLLHQARSFSPKSAQLMVAAQRSFFRFLFQEGETETDLADAVPSIPTWRLAGVPKYLKPEEVQRVIDNCPTHLRIGRRDRTLLLMIARLGLRAGEVIALTLDDIDWREGTLMIRGKGGYHDRLPLPLDVGQALAAYLHQDRPPCDTRHVFIRGRAPHRGLGHPSTISTIVGRALIRAGLEPPRKGAHLLRHSLATEMLRGGASMAEIGQILRHRTPQTTEIYAKVDLEGLRSIARVWPTSGGVR